MYLLVERWSVISGVLFEGAGMPKKTAAGSQDSEPAVAEQQLPLTLLRQQLKQSEAAFSVTLVFLATVDL